jgi:hypothetical protein
MMLVTKTCLYHQVVTAIAADSRRTCLYPVLTAYCYNYLPATNFLPPVYNLNLPKSNNSSHQVFDRSISSRDHQKLSMNTSRHCQAVQQLFLMSSTIFPQIWEPPMRGRPVGRWMTVSDSTIGTPNSSSDDFFTLLSTANMQGHTLAYLRPSIDEVVRLWRSDIPQTTLHINPDSIRPSYPDGWPDEYLPEVGSPPAAPNYMAPTAGTTAKKRSNAHISAADRMRTYGQPEIQVEDKYSDEYIFDDGFQERWNEGMRQAAARKEALAREKSTSGSLPSKPWDGYVEDATPKAKQRK